MKPRNKREYLRKLVSEKNSWVRPLTDEEKDLGFLGWHERGYLPHCDFPNIVQFVTFRLVDSMPASRRGEWEHLLKLEDVRERREKLEAYLDRGVGTCDLRNRETAQLTEDALLYFHGERYDLLAWCIMPNHVHVLLHVWQTPLWKILQNWKIHLTNQLRRSQLRNAEHPLGPIQEITNTPSRCSALRSFWQREYWDTFMRNEEQQHKAVRYIENNPVKARLCRTAEDWPFSSARQRDQFHKFEILGKEVHV